MDVIKYLYSKSKKHERVFYMTAQKQESKLNDMELKTVPIIGWPFGFFLSQKSSSPARKEPAHKKIDAVIQKAGRFVRTDWLAFLHEGAAIFEKYAEAYDRQDPSSKQIQKKLDDLHALLVDSIQKARQDRIGLFGYADKDFIHCQLSEEDDSRFSEANLTIINHLTLFFQKKISALFASGASISTTIGQSLRALCHEKYKNGYIVIRDEIIRYFTAIEPFYLQAKHKKKLKPISELVALKLDLLYLMTRFSSYDHITKAVSDGLVLTVFPPEDQAFSGLPLPHHQGLHNMVLHMCQNAGGYPDCRSAYQDSFRDWNIVRLLLLQLNSQGMQFSMEYMSHYETDEMYHTQKYSGYRTRELPRKFMQDIYIICQEGINNYSATIHRSQLSVAITAQPLLLLHLPIPLVNLVIDYVINSTENPATSASKKEAKDSPADPSINNRAAA